MSAHNVVWVHRFDHLATYRYRAAMPAAEVAKHNGFVTGVNEGEADIIVFSKPVRGDIAIATNFKNEGAKIVVDLSDDHFSKGEIYQQIAKIADGVVCATDIMRSRIWDETGREACVIADPYEFPEKEPHANGDDFLWFGHQTNFNDLALVMHAMGQRKLRVVTGPKIVPNTIPWSLENMQKAFDLSNIALFPAHSGSEHKSPNRLVNALRQGLFGVCMMHPAYFPLRDFVWVGDFHTGLRWCSAFQDELNDRVREGQDYIRDRYSPETVGKQWASFLESL